MATLADIEQLVRNARDADYCPFVLAQASHPDGADPAAGLADAIGAVGAGTGDVLGASPPHLTPYGAASQLNGVDAAADGDITAWFLALAEALTADGWTGTLRPLVWGDRPRGDAGNDPWLATTIALAGWTHVRKQVVVPPWTSAPALVPSLVELAMAWVSAVDGDLWFDAMTPVRGSLDSVRASLFARLAEESDGSFCEVRRQTWGRERRVRFSAYGHVTLEERSSDDLVERLSTLRSATLPWASQLDRSCITGDVGPGHPSWFVETGRDKLPRWYYPHARHLDSRRVPDACAEQVLTSEHLAAAHDLRDWQVREVAPERFLVTHPEPHQWFLHAPDKGPGTHVDPEVLARARTDFGSMILSEVDEP